MNRLVATLCAAGAVSIIAGIATANAQNVPPPPPNIAASPTATNTPAPTPTPVLPPGVLPSPAPPGATVSVPLGKGKATPTPAPPKEDENRVGISGVWEVQIQDGAKTTYTHFKLAQKESALTGEYLDTNNKKFPLAGTIDGKNVRIIVSLPAGGSISFNGSVENLTDMLGMLQTGNNAIPFTAAYRPKYKWLDNINPSAGMGTP
ncbi:MAG: hypothetical protein JO165_13525 [Candidatus Eremiobacteraeota bacterium]|nr:hypothetical protein [Candidatus Eremiobacteraeota bacterium]